MHYIFSIIIIILIVSNFSIILGILGFLLELAIPFFLILLVISVLNAVFSSSDDEVGED